MKRSLLEETSIYLLKKGFTIKSLTSSCFDIVARKDGCIMLLKTLEDANSITSNHCEEMVSVSSYVDGTPLIIANRAGFPLEDNVVYKRLGIFTINLSTFSNCINNRLPILKKTQAGLTAKINGKRLRELREEQGYSLNSLSRRIGVTTKMVVKYENGNSEITLSNAKKLYGIFGEDIFNRVNVMSPGKILENNSVSPYSRQYQKLGFTASDLSKVPFDIIAKKGNEIILTEVSDKANPNLESITRLLDADSLVIFKKKKPRDLPAMTRQEFMEFVEASDLIKFVKEF